MSSKKLGALKMIGLVIVTETICLGNAVGGEGNRRGR